jgi:pimeloyl-ACP methyl ester carboxylesterase
MATFGLVPGAGGDASYWYLLEPELRRHGHEVVAVELPAGDDSAGIPAYVDTIERALGDRRDVVLVAQSLGGFSAPIVCARRPVDLLVLVAAMVPSPGETAGEWWDDTGQSAAMKALAERERRSAEFDLVEYFFHDVPDDVIAEVFARPEPVQSDAAFADPWPLDEWPDVPTRFILGRDDRFFPADWLRQLVIERLGITPDELPGGHLLALSRPVELAGKLLSYLDPAER